MRHPVRAELFAERAMRLRQLAAGHSMRDYLIFMADLAQEQQRLLSEGLSLPLPDLQTLAQAVAAELPPLPATEWPRPAVWRQVLARLVSAMRARVGKGAAAATLDHLSSASDEQLEQQADRLLNGVMLGLDLGTAPLIAAALQVVWTELLLQTQASHGALVPPPFGRIADASICPCCGSRPTASVVRLDGKHAGQRYLHCSLCALQWHRVRIQCARCGKGDHIHYQALKPEPGHTSVVTGATEGAVQAECCDDCGHYLKLVHATKDAHAEPAADDLASVTLDLLVAETGLQRHGVNLMLLFGDPDAAPDPGAG